MGVSLGAAGSGKRLRPMAEINVTPFVDVMLVLLIVFMVTAPLLTVGIAVELPDTEAEAIADTGEPLSVTVMADGTVFVQDTMIPYDNLIPHLQAVARAGYQQRIYIRGDKDATYDLVAQVLGRINAAGYTSIALVTD